MKHLFYYILADLLGIIEKCRRRYLRGYRWRTEFLTVWKLPIGNKISGLVFKFQIAGISHSESLSFTSFYPMNNQHTNVNGNFTATNV